MFGEMREKKVHLWGTHRELTANWWWKLALPCTDDHYRLPPPPPPPTPISGWVVLLLSKMDPKDSNLFTSLLSSSIIIFHPSVHCYVAVLPKLINNPHLMYRSCILLNLYAICSLSCAVITWSSAKKVHCMDGSLRQSVISRCDVFWTNVQDSRRYITYILKDGGDMQQSWRSPVGL